MPQNTHLPPGRSSLGGPDSNKVHIQLSTDVGSRDGWPRLRFAPLYSCVSIHRKHCPAPPSPLSTGFLLRLHLGCSLFQKENTDLAPFLKHAKHESQPSPAESQKGKKKKKEESKSLRELNCTHVSLVRMRN